MTTLTIVVALVVAVLVFVALSRVKRGGTQLQGPPSTAPRARPIESAARGGDARTPSEGAVLPGAHPSTQEARAEAPAASGGPPAAKAVAPSVPVPKKDIAGLRKGLSATRGGFVARLATIFQGKKEIDPAILEQVEEVLLSSDVGPKTTHTILGRLRDALARDELRDSAAIWAALRAEAVRILAIDGGSIRLPKKPTVVLVVGVNGVGKTTTIGKLATRFHLAGKKVVFAAGDTFRAAAVQQLEVWSKRAGAEVVKGKEGADPGAVAFDATTYAKESGADILFVDTAGRLHTKAPLMDEIKKVRKTIAKAMDGAPHETLLVLDATTGQNALAQAAMFKEAVDLTGIVLTKLDGTAKGGIVLGICDELKMPVRYIGLGERADDLREFDAHDFVEALFGTGDEEAAA